MHGPLLESVVQEWCGSVSPTKRRILALVRKEKEEELTRPGQIKGKGLLKRLHKSPRAKSARYPVVA